MENINNKPQQKSLFGDLGTVTTVNTLNVNIDTNTLIKIGLTIIFVALFLLVVKKQLKQ